MTVLKEGQIVVGEIRKCLIHAKNNQENLFPCIQIERRVVT